MKPDTAVIISDAGKLLFGVVNEVVTRTSKNGEKVSIECVVFLPEGDNYEHTFDADKVISLDSFHVYGADKVLIVDNDGYKWARAMEEARNQLAPVPVPPAPRAADPLDKDIPF